MATVNMVKYYFYRNIMPDNQQLLKSYIALAYQTARDRKLYPKAVLIRSVPHDTTTINGVYQKDPDGWHVTFCYKDDKQLENDTHVACHGYMPGEDTFELVKSTHRGEKPDSTKKKKGGIVWPSEDELAVAPEIGYGHLDPAENTGATK